MPRSRFLVLVVLVMLASSSLFASRVAAQAPPDLKAAALSPSDLEPNWRVLFETSADGEAYTVVLGRRSREALGILLVNDPLREISPVVMLDFGETWMESAARTAGRTGGGPGVLTVERGVSPAIGEEAVQSSVRLAMATGTTLNGAVLAWRQGPVVVTMYYLTDEATSVVPLAEQQSAKLATALSAAMQAPGAPASGTGAGSGRPAGRTLCMAILAPITIVASAVGGETGNVTVGSSSGTVCTIRS